MTRLPILAAALLTLAACQQAEAPAAAPATGATPAVATTGRAQVAPAFTLIDSEGVARSLADFRGKTVVIEWTNEGCPYVQKHYSSGAMQALQREAVADGVVWLTVISSAPGKQGHVEGEGARAWRTRNNAASTHLLLDPEGTVGKAYGAMTTPDMRVIDGEGRILFTGGIDDRPTNEVRDLEGANNFVRAALEDVEAGRPVRTAYAQPYGCSIKYAEEA
ncbi:redoxin domain-containing protein [Brevundimonas sp. TWP2-3-2]|uniref:redoxin domain-containing protein n=1 Tax=unclassified Brevundimonas TaxID=2622653 RepID=UPI003CF73C94